MQVLMDDESLVISSDILKRFSQFSKIVVLFLAERTRAWYTLRFGSPPGRYVQMTHFEAEIDGKRVNYCLATSTTQ